VTAVTSSLSTKSFDLHEAFDPWAPYVPVEKKKPSAKEFARMSEEEFTRRRFVTGSWTACKHRLASVDFAIIPES
jgi:hypothetical protein